MISLSRRLLFIFFLNILSNGAPASLVQAQPSLISLIEQKKEAIVTIQAQMVNPESNSPDSTGTGAAFLEKTGAGIVIDPTGYIVTNTHTILYAQFIFVTFHDGTRLTARIAAIAPDTDFTLLKVEPSSALRTLTWSDPQKISLGTEVISIGNSELWMRTICGGKITGIAKKISQDTVALFEMDLDLDRGDSGGPLLDRQGNFLGIITAKNTRTPRSSYAIPSSGIQDFFLNHLNESRR